MNHPWSRIYQRISIYRWHDPSTWLERGIVWIYAILVGLVVSFYVRLSEEALVGYRWCQQHLGYGLLALTPLGTMFIVFCVRRYYPGSEGSGIPQVIAALRDTRRLAQLRGLVSLPIALAKILLGACAIALGLSTGREGPCVQIAASLMRQCTRWLPGSSRLQPDQLMLAGGAAGIAGAFNTPLAGIVFAIEELSRQFEEGTSGVLLTAIILAGMVSTSLLGNGLYFGHVRIHTQAHLITDVFMCALVCGVCGGLFAQLFIFAAQKSRFFRYWKSEHPYINAATCGAAVALLALFTAGSVNGSGYDVTHDMLMHGQQVSLSFAPLKALATWLSFHSGVPGGLFAPTLAIGAGIGRDLQAVLAGDANLLYVLAMAGFLAAVTQAPITASVIVMEMIDGHTTVMGLLAVTLLSSLIARIFSPPLYATLALNYLAATNALPAASDSLPAVVQDQADNPADKHRPV